MAGAEMTHVGRRDEETMELTTVAVDLAKEVFQVALANRGGASSIGDASRGASSSA